MVEAFLDYYTPKTKGGRRVRKGRERKGEIEKKHGKLTTPKTLPLFSQVCCPAFFSFKNMLFILICNVFKATIISELTKKIVTK